MIGTFDMEKDGNGGLIFHDMDAASLSQITVKSSVVHGANQQFPFVHRGNCRTLQHCAVFCINHSYFGLFG